MSTFFYTYHQLCTQQLKEITNNTLKTMHKALNALHIRSYHTLPAQCLGVLDRCTFTKAEHSVHSSSRIHFPLSSLTCCGFRFFSSRKTFSFLYKCKRVYVLGCESSATINSKMTTKKNRKRKCTL